MSEELKDFWGGYYIELKLIKYRWKNYNRFSESIYIKKKVVKKHQENFLLQNIFGALRY